MATYNGAQYIKEQMDSVLTQRFVKNSDVKMEIIVSDDLSTDDTVKIIEGYHDSRIRIYSHSDRRLLKHYTALYAATANFANAISKATGEYIFLSDQDDIWYPNKIDDTLEVLMEKGGVVAADFDCISGDGKKIGEMVYEYESFWKIKRKFNPYGFSLGFSSDILKYIMPMPLVHQHDTFICLLAQRIGMLHYLHNMTAAHRWIGVENVSSSAIGEHLCYKVWVKVKLYFFVLLRAIMYCIDHKNMFV